MNNKSDRKTQIIEDAISVLIEGGYANATIGNIAKKSRISKGVITYHFHQKEELMKAVIEYCFASAIPFMEKSMEGLEDAQSLLKGYIESNIKFMFEHREYVKAMAEIIANVRNERGELYYQEDESIYEPLIEIFKFGQMKGVFREFSPNIMAKVVRSSIDDLGMKIIRDSQLNIEFIIQELTEIFYFATRRVD